MQFIPLKQTKLSVRPENDGLPLKFFNFVFRLTYKMRFGSVCASKMAKDFYFI